MSWRRYMIGNNSLVKKYHTVKDESGPPTCGNQSYADAEKAPKEWSTVFGALDKPITGVPPAAVSIFKGKGESVIPAAEYDACPESPLSSQLNSRAAMSHCAADPCTVPRAQSPTARPLVHNARDRSCENAAPSPQSFQGSDMTAAPTDNKAAALLCEAQVRGVQPTRLESDLCPMQV